MSQADRDRLLYYSRKVKIFEFIYKEPEVHPSTYLRIGQLFSSGLFPSLRHLSYDLDYYNKMSYFQIFLHLVSPLLDSLELSDIKDVENTIVGPFLASLSSQMLRRIVLTNGKLSGDILKKSIVHFKHLRSIELLDAVSMENFVVWEVLGTLPSLEDVILLDTNPHLTHAQGPESSNSRSGGPRYFEALKSLHVTSSFIFIRHLLGFIDSPCLKSIKIYPVIYHLPDQLEPEDLFTPSMTLISSKWSQSLKNLVISSSPSGRTERYSISKCLILLKNLRNMQTFFLDWRMKTLDDDDEMMVMSWPKLKTLNLNQTQVSLLTLMEIAKNCPELRHLHIQLDTSYIPHFDTSSKSLHHSLEDLTVGRAHPSTISTKTTLECQIKVARYLDLIFPYLKSIKSYDVFWSGIRDLVLLCQNASLSRVK